MSCAFNISKHKFGWYWEQANLAGNRAIIVILLQSSGLEADATIADHNEVNALIAGTSNEATFTNYARKTITGAAVPVPIIDDTNNRVLHDLADQTYTAATAGQAIGAVLLAYDPDTTVAGDATLIPLLKLDITATTDGNDMIIRFHADGVSRVL